VARMVRATKSNGSQLPATRHHQQLFSLPGRDPSYEAVRLDENHADVRAFIEAMWEEYRPYADTDFVEGSRNHDFQSRYWELYLGCSLIRLGCELASRLKGNRPSRSLNQGPDFRTLVPFGAWIEAVAPGVGTNEDAVPELPVGTANSVPDDEAKLRLLQAIRNKAKKRLTYVQNGLVAIGDCYVVAINTGKLPHVPDLDPPRIVRAVLGLGLPQVSVDRVSGAFSDAGFQSQPEILRRPSGSAVSTRVFLESEYSEHPNYAGYEGLSAVLSSNMNPFNTCEPFFDHTKFIVGDDYCLVHNPRAANPLPRGSLKVGREYWVDAAGVLQSKLWLQGRGRRSEST